MPTITWSASSHWGEGDEAISERMHTTDTLAFEQGIRPDHGSGTRVYFDFVVSGQSLRGRLGPHGGLISVFSNLYRKQYREEIRSRLLLADGKTDDRVPLYVCPECGDPDCGIVSAAISNLGNKVIWSEFRYEVPHAFVAPDWKGRRIISPQMKHPAAATMQDSRNEPIPDLDRFEFERDEYCRVFNDPDLRNN